MFPAADKSAEVAESTREPLDFLAAAVAAQFAAILSVLAAAIVLVRRDEPDTVRLPPALTKRIAIVSAVANHSFRLCSRGTLLDGVQEPGVLAYDWSKKWEQVTWYLLSNPSMDLPPTAVLAVPD
jgi:hypothetical protein